MAFKTIHAVIALIVFVFIIILAAYAQNITLNQQQKNALFLFFGLLMLAGFVALVIYLLRKQPEIDDESKKAYLFATKWWSDVMHSTLKAGIAEARSGVFGEGTSAETIYYFMLESQTSEPVLLFVGTSPWRMANWCATPPDELKKPRPDNQVWKFFNEYYPPKPTKGMSVSEMPAAWRAGHAKNEININTKAEKDESTKDRRAKEENKEGT